MKKFFAFITTLLLASLCAALFACAPPEAVYEYGAEQVVTPFWFNTSDEGTVIYNEVAVPVSYGGDTAIARLAYTPTRVISVRDYTLDKEYSPSDYTVSGNSISVKTDGSMPYLEAKWIDGVDVPEDMTGGTAGTQPYNDGGGLNGGQYLLSEGSLFRTRHLSVTYETADAIELDTPEYVPGNFPNLLPKLQAGEPIRILVFGDSIFTGASASSVVGFEPELPAFFELMREFLADRFYGGDASKIALVNPSVGGVLSSWGADQVKGGAIDMDGFDLVVLGFGINDGSLLKSAASFVGNTRTMIDGIRAHSPSADFIVVGSFAPNPKSVFWGEGRHADYIEPTRALCDEKNGSSSGCTYVGLYDLSLDLLANKQDAADGDTRYRYLDLSANFTNHPNDFMVRLYAGCILSTFVEFESAAAYAD